jgi:hypothetical protein
MRKVCLAIVAVGLAAGLTAGPASALERHACGNYGYPKGYEGDHPIFTNKPIVGAGVENIRTRVIGCRRGRRMVKAFWNDQFVCNGDGTRCTYRSYRCGNRRLGDELWLMRCFRKDDRDRMLKFRFGA